MRILSLEEEGFKKHVNFSLTARGSEPSRCFERASYTRVNDQPGQLMMKSDEDGNQLHFLGLRKVVKPPDSHVVASNNA